MGSAQDAIYAESERARKEASEAVDRHLPREDAQINEGVKAVLAINGSAIVTMLGFMQALLTKGAAFTTFKHYGSVAMLLFSIGLIAALLVYPLRAGYINAILLSWKYHRTWELASYIMWGASMVLFMSGVGFAGAGILRGLP